MNNKKILIQSIINNDILKVAYQLLEMDLSQDIKSEIIKIIPKIEEDISNDLMAFRNHAIIIEYIMQMNKKINKNDCHLIINTEFNSPSLSIIFPVLEKIFLKLLDITISKNDLIADGEKQYKVLLPSHKAICLVHLFRINKLRELIDSISKDVTFGNVYLDYYGQPIKVMIIEDEPELAEDLKYDLLESGYEVTGVASTLREAHIIYDSNPPDIVVTDIMLGNKEPGGIQFVNSINKNNEKQTPVVFLTGMNDRETYKKALESGNYVYLIKPFNILEIESAIESSIEKSGIRSDAPENNESLIFLQNHLFVKKRSELIKVAFSDIIRIEADKKHQDIYLEGEQRFTITSSLKKLEQMLPDYFTMVRRDCLLNFNKVTRMNLNENIIHLDNGKNVHSSREYQKRIRDSIGFLS